jgi:hypothetical protein
MKVTILHTATVMDDDIDVEFTAECTTRNDGIGGYEYMGFRGYDEGRDYEVVDNVRWDESLFDTWQNQEIKKLSKSTEVEDAIIEEYKSMDYRIFIE